MIELLARLLIKNRENLHDPAVRRAYGALCGGVGILLNALLFIAKYVAGMLTGSIAITADAFNNLSDAGSSVITFLGFKLAGKKPDRHHPFGHGRSESIAGLIVSFAILLMGFELGKGSAEKILHPEDMAFSWVSVGILAASILVKLYMALFNRRVARKIGSVTMRAVAVDSLSDVCATAVVLASTLVSRFAGLNIDGWAGAAVSLAILWAGYSAARETIDPLLGNAPDPKLVEKIESLVQEYPDVVGMHDLLVHDYGAGRLMISFHAEVSASGDILALHEVIDAIERRLQLELGCSATIHMDPLSTDDSLISATLEKLRERIRDELGDEISIHDFRMVPRVGHTNVIFDAVIPYGFPMSDKEAKREIARLVREIDGGFLAVITIDHQ